MEATYGCCKRARLCDLGQDYHVILLYSKLNSALIYDFDTTLTFPCDARIYWTETFRLKLNANYDRYFRVINGSDYLQHFSSNRSHMLEANGNYKAPVPSWPTIYHPDIGNNLHSFISMDSHLLEDISKVYDENSFRVTLFLAVRKIVFLISAVTESSNQFCSGFKFITLQLLRQNFEMAISFCYVFLVGRRALTTSPPIKNIKQFCIDLAKEILFPRHIRQIYLAMISKQCLLFPMLFTQIVSGFDPTAESLHIGHLLVLTNLFRATLHGCHAIALIGGATAYVGDPSGQIADRIIVPDHEIDQYVRKISLQLMKLFNNFTEDNTKLSKHLSIVNNSDWHFKARKFSKMSSIQFLEICRDFRLGDMLRLGMVRSRMRDGSGLSCSEFLYQIFQSYDWYRLSRDYNCHFQIGGNDQLGHFDAGYDYIKRRVESYERKTSPFTFYQYFRQKPDSVIVPLLKKWIAQEKLAEELTKSVHGSNGLKMAKRCSKLLFMVAFFISYVNISLWVTLVVVKEMVSDSLSELRKMPTTFIEEQFGSASVQQLFRSSFSTMGELADTIHSGDGSSINKMKAGALKLNGIRFTDPDEVIDFDKICLDGKNITLVCWGKRKYHLVKWIDD
ncbi:Tyrosine--tRNA ligase [Dirofilaria immitis]|nr:Tyrosine--tRNA ligase [Dirofilaria immitis]